MEKTTFIYALCEPGTRTVRYIGKTASTPQKRLKRHLKESIKLNTHLGFWLSQVVSCGAAPDMFVLREVPGDGSEAEKRFIRLARGCRMNLVNGTDGGEGILNPSPELRQKRREARLGTKLSVETIEKLREQKLGDKNPQFGRQYSDEERKKMSESLSGDKNPNFGKCGVQSFHFGRKRSEETKARMAAAQKLVWARRKAAQS